MKQFPIECCVSGCVTSAYNADELERYMFPFVRREPSRRFSTDHCMTLYEKRYQLWVDALQMQSKDTHSSYVCHKHFVRGRPANIRQQRNVDWVPTLGLSTLAIRACKSLTVLLEDIGPLLTKKNEPKIEPSSLVEECVSDEQAHDFEGPFCRLCLSRATKLRPLFPPHCVNNRLLELIYEIACIRIEFKTDYNCFICYDCERRIEDINSFRLRWKSNDLELKTYRQNQTTIANIYGSQSMPQEQDLPSSSTTAAQEIESYTQAPTENQIMIEDEVIYLPESDTNEHEKNALEKDFHPVGGVVSVPIERLMENREECESSFVEQNRPSEEEVKIEFVVGETQFQDVEFVSSSVQRNAFEDSRSNIEEKGRLIEKVMKMIRSDVLSRKKKKSWKRNNTSLRVKGCLVDASGTRSKSFF